MNIGNILSEKIETIWKTNAFSMNPDNPEMADQCDSKCDSLLTPNVIDPHYRQNTETERMERKMKRLQQRKKYKDNVQNIQLLDNIYDPANVTKTINETFENYDGFEQFKYAIYGGAKDDAATAGKEGFSISGPLGQATSMFSSTVTGIDKAVTQLPNWVDRGVDAFATAYVKTFMHFDNRKLPELPKKTKNPKKKMREHMTTINPTGPTSKHDPNKRYVIDHGLGIGTAVANPQKVGIGTEDDDDDLDLNNLGDRDKSGTPPLKDSQILANDKAIVKQIVYYIIALPLAVFIMYNWLFILVYKHPGYNPDFPSSKDPERPSRDPMRVKFNLYDYFDIIVKYFGSPKAYDFFNFFFKYTLQPIWLLDKGFLGDGYFPKIFGAFPSRIIIKFIVLWYSFLFIFFMGFFGHFSATLNGSPSVITQYSSAVIFSLLAYTIITDGVSIAKDYSALGMLGLVFILIIFSVICFVIAVWSINISNLIIIIFLWAHSLFGMVIYGGGFSNLWNNIKAVDEFIERDIRAFNDKDTNFIEPNVFTRFMRKITSFMYSNVLNVFFMSILLHCMVLASTMKSYTTSTVTEILLVLSLVMASIYAIFQDSPADKKKKAAPATKEANTGGEPTQSTEKTTEDMVEGENITENTPEPASEPAPTPEPTPTS